MALDAACGLSHMHNSTPKAVRTLGGRGFTLGLRAQDVKMHGILGFWGSWAMWVSGLLCVVTIGDVGLERSSLRPRFRCSARGPS